MSAEQLTMGGDFDVLPEEQSDIQRLFADLSLKMIGKTEPITGLELVGVYVGYIDAVHGLNALEYCKQRGDILPTSALRARRDLEQRLNCIAKQFLKSDFEELLRNVEERKYGTWANVHSGPIARTIDEAVHFRMSYWNRPVTGRREEVKA